VAQRKTERLLNLVILLLNTRRPVTAAQIRDIVPGYPDGGEAFGRMFERDKAELRDLGIPVSVEGLSSWDDEVGYLIRPGDYALPDIELAPDEAAALALAARVWQQASLAEAASGAMLKLRAAGVDTSDVSLTGVEAHVTATEPAFEPLWQAVCDRRAVTFDYQGAGATLLTQRHVEPWGVVSWHGRWYLAGQDRDRGEARVFRLDRVKGEVKSTGQPGEFAVPDNVDVRQLVAGTATQEPRRTARIRVRSGAGLGLRRRATVSVTGDGDHDVIDVGFVGAEALADEVAGYGADAVILEPADVREIVITRLRAAAGRA
jgi:proteasome accessory factor B